MKNQRGITLVALVVTIIVLLILAGVSLSLVMGNEGILGRATNARSEYEISSAGERAELLIAEAQTAYYEAKYVGNNPDGITETTMVGFVKAYLGKHTTSAGETVAISADNTTLTVGNFAQHAITVENDKITLTSTAKWIAIPTV